MVEMAGWRLGMEESGGMIRCGLRSKGSDGMTLTDLVEADVEFEFAMYRCASQELIRNQDDGEYKELTCTRYSLLRRLGLDGATCACAGQLYQ